MTMPWTRFGSSSKTSVRRRDVAFLMTIMRSLQPTAPTVCKRLITMQLSDWLDSSVSSNVKFCAMWMLTSVFVACHRDFPQDVARIMSSVIDQLSLLPFSDIGSYLSHIGTHPASRTSWRLMF